MKTIIIIVAFIVLFVLVKNQTIERKNGCPVDDNPAWVSGKAIECKPSLMHKFIGKLVYNGFEKPEKYYELFVINSEGKEEKVYSGNYRTLGWEWTDTGQIKVSYNCGTNCLLSKIVYPASASQNNWQED